MDYNIDRLKDASNTVNWKLDKSVIGKEVPGYNGYIYLITLRFENSTYYYVGQRTNRDFYSDGYTGSGIILNKMYRSEKEFSAKKTLVVTCKTKMELDDAEKFFILYYKIKHPKNCINIANGGDGNWENFINLTEEQIRRKCENIKATKIEMDRKGLTPFRHLTEEQERNRVIGISEYNKKLYSEGKSNLSNMSDISKKKKSESLSKKLVDCKKMVAVDYERCVYSIKYVKKTDVLEHQKLGYISIEDFPKEYKRVMCSTKKNITPSKGIYEPIVNKFSGNFLFVQSTNILEYLDSGWYISMPSNKNKFGGNLGL